MDKQHEEIWKDDRLNREWDAEFLYRLSIGRNEENVRTNKGSFVLNVDAPWGQGKSFFLNAVYKTVLNKNHPAIMINAWQYDFVDDPFSICVAALDEYFKSIEEKKELETTEKLRKGLKVLRSQFLKIAWTLGKSVLKKAVNKVAENGVEEITEAFSDGKSTVKKDEKTFADEMADTVNDQVAIFTNSAIDKFAQKHLDNINDTKKSLSLFQGGLSLVIEALGESNKHSLPLFIFIDELDRCRPTYAISMLERIKHIFDIKNVVFVIATDTEALSHSINAVYGNNFKGREYLGRFFNRTYKLPAASNETIIIEILKDRGADLSKWATPNREVTYEHVSIFINQTANHFGLNIRPIKQSLDILLDITSAWSKSYPIELTYMYFLICLFVRDGKIDPVEFQKQKQKVASVWAFEHYGHLLNYSDVIDSMKSYGDRLLDDAMSHAHNVLKSDGNPINKYYYDLMLGEYKNQEGTNATNSILSFAKYNELILYSRNLS